MDGPDYRQRKQPARLLSPDEILILESSETFAKPKVRASWSALFIWLTDHHPSRYGSFVEQIGALYLYGVAPIEHPDNALRFVHFIDKLYEFKKSLRMSGSLDLANLFAPSYQNGAFAKKYYRCLSRTSELLYDLPVEVSSVAAFD